jgi:hypothetical protein
VADDAGHSGKSIAGTFTLGNGYPASVIFVPGAQFINDQT